jgi:hypothetical protein
LTRGCQKSTKYIVGLTAILREAWTASQQTEDKREKIQALSLARECYSINLDLLTNSTVVDGAIGFVSQKSSENLESSVINRSEDYRVKRLTIMKKIS